MKRNGHSVSGLGFDPVHPQSTLLLLAEELERGGHAGEEAAPAAADEDDVHLGEVVEDLEAEGAVPGDEVEVVERVEEGRAVSLMLNEKVICRNC